MGYGPCNEIVKLGPEGEKIEYIRDGLKGHKRYHLIITDIISVFDLLEMKIIHKFENTKIHRKNEFRIVHSDTIAAIEFPNRKARIYDIPTWKHLTTMKLGKGETVDNVISNTHIVLYHINKSHVTTILRPVR
jgi:hypothetical protein